jgi:hypothetical protein
MIIWPESTAHRGCRGTSTLFSQDSGKLLLCGNALVKIRAPKILVKS